VPFKCDFIDALTEYILKLNRGRDLSQFAIVFPGRRPSLFFVKSLKEKIDAPFIPPFRYSIDEFMEFLFGLKRIEKIPKSEIDLIYLLYKAIKENISDKYKGMKKIVESMDVFLEWGSKILRAIEEIEIEWAKEKDIENIAFYEDNIKDWAKDFLSRLTEIKSNYHNILKKESLTYRGEVYRYVSENIDEIEPLIPYEKIIFSGFYALNASEEKTIRYLFNNSKADIIIQTDDIDNRGEEIQKTSPYYFHQEWKKKWGIKFEKLRDEPDRDPIIKLYQSFDIHSEVLNLDSILRNSDSIEDFAIILPEPSPLIPVLNIITSAYKSDFNITLGYPLKRTSLSNLIKYIFSLQHKKQEKDGEYQYYATDYLNFIRHPYIKTLKIGDNFHIFSNLVNYLANLIISKNRNELKTFFTLQEIEEFIRDENELIRIFKNKQNLIEVFNTLKHIHSLFIHNFEDIKRADKGAEVLKKCLKFLYKNSLLEMHPLSNQFLGTFISKLEEIRYSIFSKSEDFKNQINLMKLMENYLNSIIIPFTGEPLIGTQIMGLLESRNLNFNKVVVIDVNEGVIPGVEKYDPILPQILRRDIGIPGYNEKESIYAHNFYRLIMCAKEVFLLYKHGKLNETDENIRSRFIERIIWDKEKKRDKIEIHNPVFKVESFKIKREFPKDKNIITKLIENFDYHPTAIDTYIQCPLKFYYRYVLKLKEQEEIEEDIERSTIGIFIHDFLKDYYKQFINKKVILDKRNFMETLQKELRKKFREDGGSIILSEIIKKTLERFIIYEIKKIKENDVYIRGLEENIATRIEVNGNEFRIKGWIDRVEEINGIYKIIDYKTGIIKKPIATQTLEFTQSREMIKKKIKSLQLPIYIYLYSSDKNIDMNIIESQFLSLRNPYDMNTIDSSNMNIFMVALKYILKEITNSDIPFSPDNSEDYYCKYCPYSLICPLY
jgi:CRISPR/Cas system-associated exonuclease Cas4 (RecB family)